MKVLLVGPPGAGKGTQGELLANRLLLRHVAAGDLLRAEVAAGTPLGVQAAGLMDRGELVPDQLMLDLVMPAVVSAADAGGYLLDGFPRTVGQAHAARAWLRGREVDHAGPDAVVVLEVPEDVLVERILARGRPDDTEEVVRRRLRVYAQETEPLVEFYRQEQLVHTIDGTMPVAEVSDAILAELDVPRG